MRSSNIFLLVAVAFLIGSVVGYATSNYRMVSMVSGAAPAVTVTVPTAAPVVTPQQQLLGYWKSDNSIWSGDLTFKPGGAGDYGGWPMTWSSTANPRQFGVRITRPMNDGGGILFYAFTIGDNSQTALLNLGGSTTGYTKFSSSS